MNPRRPAWLFAGLLLFAACSQGRGCLADPGAGCVPGSSDCRGDYYCAVGGVCTKACTSDIVCAPTCESNEDCAGEDAESPWRCEGAVCVCVGEACPAPVTCQGGYCLQDCGDSAQCGLDPYRKP